MKPFAYASAGTAEEAIAAIVRDGTAGTRPLAGGTDLLTLMKIGITAPSQLVDIKRIPELRGGIEEAEEGVVLGALTTLAEIETSPLIRQRYPALAESAADAATPQLRNMATLGGNLLQRPRCWYFRNAHLDCWLKGGGSCPAREGENQLHAILGGGPCYAVHPSDPAAALLALDAEVRLRGPEGERVLSLERFFAAPEQGRRTETVVRSDELLLSVRIPSPPAGTRSTYLKAMERKTWAFALAGVAALLRIDADRIQDARLVLTGVAPIPWRSREAERALIGAQATPAAFARAAEAALEDARPLRLNGYKLPLATALIQRALETLRRMESPG